LGLLEEVSASGMPRAMPQTLSGNKSAATPPPVSWIRRAPDPKRSMRFMANRPANNRKARLSPSQPSREPSSRESASMNSRKTIRAATTLVEMQATTRP
jgi:hypothetical protein